MPTDCYNFSSSLVILFLGFNILCLAAKSVTRLVEFFKFMVTIFPPKVTQMYVEFKGSFEKHHF